MNVLFVSETRFSRTPFRDRSIRYRCYNMAEALQAAGYLADVTTLDALELVNLSRYDVVSVHQPMASRNLLKVLERCAKLGIKTVADLDALEFDPKLAKESPKSRLKNSSVATIRALFMRRNMAIKQFDEVSVATEELARARRALNPNQPVYVAPNGLSNYWLSCNDHIKPNPSARQRIGFFSDNRSMGVEFAPVSDALRDYLLQSRERELYVIGPLLLSDEQFPESQVTRGAWVDFIDMPQILNECHVNVCPHQPTSINHAQPPTQFIEAAAFGLPTISSPTAELLQHDVPGLVIAETTEQFSTALEAFSDEHYRTSCQQALFEYARECCLASVGADVLIRQWSANEQRNNHETTTRLSAAG